MTVLFDVGFPAISSPVAGLDYKAFEIPFWQETGYLIDTSVAKISKKMESDSFMSEKFCNFALPLLKDNIKTDLFVFNITFYHL